MGLCVWPSSIILAQRCAAARGTAPDSNFSKHRQQRVSAGSGAGGWAGKKAIELGAGTGLLSLVLSRLGAHVLATDQQQVARIGLERMH